MRLAEAGCTRRVFAGVGLSAPWRAAARPLETPVNRALMWGVGLLLGVLTLKTEYIGAPKDLFSRIAPVDFLCIALLGLLFFRHRMKAPPWPSFVYVAAVVLSLVPGLLFTPGDPSHVWVTAAGLLMAFGYYLVGLNIGASPRLIRCLLGGLCIGVLGQAIIVGHDLFASRQWFPDPMEGRVRGTFKTNGQLGAYSFCAAGLLITFGATLGTAAFRKLCVALAILAASFVFVASRRMGMFSMFAWAFLFAILAWRFSEKRFYKVFVTGFISLLVVVAALWPQVESSFIGGRFMSAVSSIGKDEGFIQNQFKDTLDTAGNWFPFGFGVGRGARISPEAGQEVHNTFLAMLVELGVLGLVAFLAIVLTPLLKRRWMRRSREHELLGVLMTSFLLISLVFMFHNTLARDRTFLVYLGIATAVVTMESRWRVPSVYFPGGAG